MNTDVARSLGLVAAPGGGVRWTTESVIPREPWMADALCAQTDPEMFFPEKGGNTRNAKAVCAKCDVRDQCLAYALEHGEQFGIWGGLSERERRKYAKARKAVQDAGDVDELAVRLALAGERVKLNPLERRECVRKLYPLKWSDARIAERIGCSPRTVTRIRDELKLPAFPVREIVDRGAA